MADTRTADEWKAAAAKLDAQIGELERQQTQVQDQLSTLRQQQVKLLGATRNQPANSPERQQYVALSQQIAQLENQNSQISQQIQTLDTQLQAAERQAGVADTDQLIQKRTQRQLVQNPEAIQIQHPFRNPRNLLNRQM